jgi:heat shock protein HslJ
MVASNKEEIRMHREHASSARPALALVATLALCACAAAPAANDGFAPLAGDDARRTLESHRWRLDTATDASGRRIDALFPSSTRPFSLAFDGTTIFVDGACNSMRGGFRLEPPDRLAVGRLAATMKACEPALMQADAALAKALAEPLRAGVAGGSSPRLRLATPSNDTLVFAGELTHEARYGAPTVQFLEVAARRVPCPPPSPREATCLQVRDRFFDAQGLQARAPGEWRAFADPIEGYTHREGERNVLRVKRYARAAAPAGTPAYAYVLDLVVETEIVKP